jgi:hypothetical protein
MADLGFLDKPMGDSEKLGKAENKHAHFVD